MSFGTGVNRSDSNLEQAPSGSLAVSNTGYLRTLCSYFEDEIEGEAYFHALAGNTDCGDARKKLLLLARVERCTAEVARPLLEKYGLEPQPDAVLRPRGKAEARNRAESDWNVFINGMASRLPGYLDDSRALEAMAPAEDLPTLRTLTSHLVALIDFAGRERMGEPDGCTPLRRYIEEAGR